MGRNPPLTRPLPSQEPQFLDPSYDPSCPEAIAHKSIRLGLNHIVPPHSCCHWSACRLRRLTTATPRPCRASYNCKPTIRVSVCTTCLIPRRVMRGRRRNWPRIKFLTCRLNGGFPYSVGILRKMYKLPKRRAKYALSTHAQCTQGVTPHCNSPKHSPKRSLADSNFLTSACASQSLLRQSACIRCIDNNTWFINRKNLTPPKATSGRLSRNTARTQPCNALSSKNILRLVISNFPALVGRGAKRSA